MLKCKRKIREMLLRASFNQCFTQLMIAAQNYVGAVVAALFHWLNIVHAFRQRKTYG